MATLPAHPLRRGARVVALCFVAMLVAVIAAPFIGATPLSFRRVFSREMPFADNVEAQIFFVARLPRALAAALVGGTLAAAGVVFQGLLRNPLATPPRLSFASMRRLTFRPTARRSKRFAASSFGWRRGHSAR